jgi:hypothetical protein
MVFALPPDTVAEPDSRLSAIVGIGAVRRAASGTRSPG